MSMIISHPGSLYVNTTISMVNMITKRSSEINKTAILGCFPNGKNVFSQQNGHLWGSSTKHKF
jgi:hypothetical protein